MNKLLNRGGRNRNPAISVIRILAFISIITCHIMQYYDCVLAWWFNVGVQVFLCLSGYLYGRKEIADDIAFYKKQFIKILVPYYLVIIIAILAQLFFARDIITVSRVVKAFLVYGTLKDGGHLWFVSTILMCYFLTPFFNRINERILSSNHKEFCVILCFALLSVTVELFLSYFNPAWIACFYIGSVIGKNEVMQGIKPIVYKVLIYALAVCLVSIQILVSYVLKLELTGTINSIFVVLCDYGHAFLGLSIFLLLSDVLKNVDIPKALMKPICFLDSISYEGYLIHQFFIFGAFSLFNIIEMPILSSIIVYILTFILASVLKVASGKLKERIESI